MDIRFQTAETEYRRLRAMLTAGQLTSQQFAAEADRLTLTDAQGRYWTLHRDTGRWMMYTGQAWVEAVPPAGAPPPSPSPVMPAAVAPKKKGGGCGRWLLWGCLGLVILLIIAGAGGYYAYTTGRITLNDVLNLVGQGSAAVEVDNFRDDPVYVTITLVDASADSSFGSSLDLQPFDVKVSHPANPGRYRVDFGTASGASDLGTCTLTVRGGDEYQFVTTPELIVVNRVSNPPDTGPDFVITTSALCR